MFRTACLATVILAQSVSGCLDTIRNAVPTETGDTTLSSFGGSWGSVAASTAEAVCTDFSWKVTDVTASGVAGTWTARCFKTIPVSGNASASLVNGEMRWTATGTGTATGAATCAVALTGSARLENGQITIPYTGTTCLGPVAGTEILRKSLGEFVRALDAVEREPGRGAFEGVVDVLDVLHTLGLQPRAEGCRAFLGKHGHAVLPGGAAAQHA